MSAMSRGAERPAYDRARSARSASPGREPPYGELIALADLEPGTPATVQRVSEVAEHDAPDLLRELDAYGLVTGARTVTDADRSVQAVPVEVGGKTRPIGTGVARLIWVEPEPPAVHMRRTQNSKRRAVAGERRS